MCFYCTYYGFYSASALLIKCIAKSNIPTKMIAKKVKAKRRSMLAVSKALRIKIPIPLNLLADINISPAISPFKAIPRACETLVKNPFEDRGMTTFRFIYIKFRSSNFIRSP